MVGERLSCEEPQTEVGTGWEEDAMCVCVWCVDGRVEMGSGGGHYVKGGRVGGEKGLEALTSACVQNTPLMWASSEGMTSMVEKFLAFGAKAERTNQVKGRGLVGG